MMMGISVNVKALIVTLLYYLLLEGVIIGFSTGQRTIMGEQPPSQIVLFAAMALLYPVFTYLYLKEVRWAFITTMVLAALVVLTQTPFIIPWLGRMSEWWIATWGLLYILPALIIFFCYRALRESE